MANRFWVGGGSSTSWAAITNTNWSATSGGANNASVPTAADDVFFDANSTGTCNIITNVSCHSLDMTNCNAGMTITSSGTRTLNVGGAASTGLGAAICKLIEARFSTMTGCTLSFDNRSGGVTVSMLSGAGYPGPMSTDTTHTNTVTIATDCSFTSITHNRATLLVAATKILSTGSFTITGAQAKTLSYSNATVIANGLATTGSAGAVSFTGDADSLFKLTSTSININVHTFPGLNPGKGFRCEGGIGTFTIPNGCTYGRFSFIQTASIIQLVFPIIAGGVPGATTLEIVGLSPEVRLFARGAPTVSSGFNATNVEFTNVDFYRAIIGGPATPVTTVAVGDCGGNAGVTFSAAVNRYWVGDSGNWLDPAHWSATSGGSGGASVPLPQDTSIVNNNSFSTTGFTITCNAPRIGALDASSCTIAHTITFNFNQANYGANGDTILSSSTISTGTWGALKYGATITFTQNGATCTSLAIVGRGTSDTTIRLGSDAYVASVGSANIGFGATSFDMNSYNLQATLITWANGTFTVSSYKTITLTQSGTVLNYSGGQIITDGTADILATGTAVSISWDGGISGSFRNISIPNLIASNPFSVSVNNPAVTFSCDTLNLPILNTNYQGPLGLTGGKGTFAVKFCNANQPVIGFPAGSFTTKLARGIVGDQLLQRATFRGWEYAGTSPDVTTYGGAQSSHTGSNADINVSLTNSPRVRSSVAIL